MSKTRTEKRIRRQKKVRSRVEGTTDRPRLSVFKSNTAIYAQLINDEKGETLGAFDSRKIKEGKLTEKATQVGEEMAKLAKGKKIDRVVFDRAGFKFTGAVKNLAEGARKGGLKF
jgi:large subunit ribosomal protein L18